MRTAERTEFLADLIITAVEGGTGYWACVSEYNNDEPSTTYAVLHENVDDDDESADTIEGGQGYYPAHFFAHIPAPRYSSTPLRLDVESVAKALSTISSGPVKNLSESVRKHLIAASRENDAGELDADDADIVAQLALLGEIVYG